uniref:Uncharacterized protein n=1 Tax=Lepeophtheirus salmonis TaxID=72036 RepID=A0A0K2ULJ1_LEPSM
MDVMDALDKIRGALHPKYGNLLIYVAIRPEMGLITEQNLQVAAPSNFSIILRIVDSEGRLCGS